MKRTIFIVATIIAIAGVSLVGLKQGLHRIDCKKRNEAFSHRVKIVEQDAHTQLKVGTKKDEVARFYTQHEIPFQFVWLKDVGSEAIGTLYTVGGCAPLGCGSNSALIGVRVKVDVDGGVTGEPEIVSMYTDCL